ncbi:hypothetical protein D3C72_2452300 [compost metagenome]
MAAPVKTVKNSKVWPTICCDRKVSSLTKMTEATDVILSMPIALPASAGRMLLSA